MPTRRAGVTLGLALSLATAATGCSHTAPPPAAAPVETPPAQPGTAGEAQVAPGSPVVVAGYELDAAKHAVPSAPATGLLDGSPFVPTEVSLTGTELTFAAMKSGDAPSVARSLTIKFPATGVKLAEGFKLVVAADQPESAAVPGVDTFSFVGDKPSGQVYVNGYALTLELGKRDAGVQVGKIAVSLPDAGKSYLAGTFTAQARRAPGDLPGPDESPAVHGLVTSVGESKGDLEVGLIGQPAGQVVTETVSLAVAGPPGRFTRTESPRPTTLALTAGGQFRYEHVKLPPGRYLVWARQTPGPLAWKWVAVAAGTATDAPLTLDAKLAGKLAVTTTQPTGTLRLLPKDGDAPPPVPELALGYALKLDAPFDAKAFDAVPPGRYDLIATLKSGDEWDRKPVEVKPGETVAVKLK